MKKNVLIVYANNTNSKIEVNGTVNDIFEINNNIIIVGNKILIYKYENNNLTNIQSNDNLNNEILTCINISTTKFFICCGHLNGNISFYNSNDKTLMAFNFIRKIHDSSINKIYIKSNVPNNTFLITLGKDNFLKVFSVDNNLNEIKSLKVNDEPVDIIEDLDFEQRNNFIVSMNNGNIIVLNNDFQEIFDIKSRYNCFSQRIVISIQNPQNVNNNNQNSNIGNFLLITDGKYLDINAWIKTNSFHINKHHNNHNNNNNFNQNNMNNMHNANNFNNNMHNQNKFNNNYNNNNYNNNYNNNNFNNNFNKNRGGFKKNF